MHEHPFRPSVHGPTLAEATRLLFSKTLILIPWNPMLMPDPTSRIHAHRSESSAVLELYQSGDALPKSHAQRPCRG